MSNKNPWLPSAALFLFVISAATAEPSRLTAEQTQRLFGVSPGEPSAFAEDADLIAAITPAVVSVFPARIVQEEDGADPLDRFFNRDRSGPGGGEGKDDASRDNERVQGVGSGVVLTEDGWIVTNSHVIHFQNGKLADAISVEFPDRRRFDAEIIGADPLTDLALLKIKTAGLKFLPLADSDTLRVGHPVYAVGNPFKLGITATKGMVSALRRGSLGIIGDGGFESFIQTDAAINPGNSGGVLADRYGRLAGINTAIWGSGGGNVGIGFAIPSNLVRNIVSQLAESGRVERGFFGWQIAEPTRSDIDAAGLASMAGAKLDQIMEGGPAAAAGLRAGDIILEAAGQPVLSRGDLRFLASLVKPEDTLTLSGWRSREQITATLTAGKNAGKAEATGASFRLDLLPGIDFRKSGRGIEVEKINAQNASATGFTAGMEVTEINGTPVKTGSDASEALTNGVNQIKARKGSEEVTLAIRLPLTSQKD